MIREFVRCFTLLCAVTATTHNLASHANLPGQVRIDSLLVIEKDNSIMIVIIEPQNQVYRSTNWGAEWFPIESDEGPVIAESVVQSTADKKRLFFTGWDGKTHWVSADGGRTVLKAGSTMPLRSVIWHPFEPHLALAYEVDTGCRADAAFRCFGNLVLSEDSGQTWRMILARVKYPNFQWGQHHAKDTTNLERLHKNNIIAVHHRTTKSAKGMWDPDLDFVVSDDFFKTKTTLVKGGNNFIVSGRMIFVAKARTQVHVGLMVSSNHKTFKRAEIPVDLKENSFSLLHDLEEQAIVLAVRMVSGTDSTLYTSGSSGLRWATSLASVHYGKGRAADIFSLEGIAGVYMANQVQPGNVGTGVADGLKTVVSFDRGGSWQPLKAPKADSKGEPFPCQLDTEAMANDQCHLHLFFKGNKGQYSSLYTTENAIGLIMGTGRVGASLADATAAKGLDEPDQDPDMNFYGEEDVGTFLSRDAGRTWTEVKKGGWLYAYGDHGGVIVMVPDQRPTKEVLYSLNEGAEWMAIPIQLIVPTAIVAPELGTSLRFLVVGAPGPSSPQGAVVTLDLGALPLKRCVGQDTPGEPNSDYERWNLRAPIELLKPEPDLKEHLHSSVGCLLGRRIFYTRRKQNSKCYNGVEHEHRSASESCECVDSDFECDYGFSSAAGSLECKLQAEALSGEEKARIEDLVHLHSNPTLSHELCNRYAADSSDTHELVTVTGYRRIPGDFCVGGADKAGNVVVCTAPLITSGHGWFLVGVLGVVVVCGAGFLMQNIFGGQADRYHGYRRATTGEQDPWENMGLFNGGMDHEGEGGFTEEY